MPQANPQASRRERNAEMRQTYLRLTDAIEQAQEQGDDRSVRRLTTQRSRIAEDFVNANAGLAVQMAKKVFPHGNAADAAADDYVAAAMTGMWEAFTIWDPEQASFAHFAQTYIWGATGRAVRALEASEISYGDFSARPAVRAAFHKLAGELNREPTYAEVAEECGHHIDLVQRVLTATPTSLDAPLTSDGGTLGDVVAATDDTTAEEALGIDSGIDDLLGRGSLEAIAHALRHLSAAELWVLSRRYGIDGAPPQSLVAIGQDIDKGRQSVQRHSATALSTVSNDIG